MRSHRASRFLLFTAVSCATAATTQSPPPPPPIPTTDSFFQGIEKFEKNAAHVTRVESDQDRDRHSDARSLDTAAPRHLSTVYVFAYDRPGLYNPVDVDVYRRKLHTAEWTCMTCEGRLKPGEAIDACTRSLGPSTMESVVIQMRSEKLTFVHTVGRPSSDSHNSTACRED